MLTSIAPSARLRRPLTGAIGAGLLLAGTVGVVALTQGQVLAAAFQTVDANPRTGTDSTLFGGSVTTDCPRCSGWRIL